MQISALVLALCIPAHAAVTVSTAQYGNARTAANTAETVLTPANVANIQKLGTYTLDGNMYGQPLVIDGTTRYLIGVTMNGSIYAFDARVPGSQIWTRNVGAPITSHPAMSDNFLYQGPVGCFSTPVVDTSAAVVYAVCGTAPGTWKLYAFNLADGTDFHSPVTIAGSNNGVTFDGSVHMNRAALGLVGGKINIAFAGYGDIAPYQGWVFVYDSTTLTQTGVWANTSTSNGEGGMWWSGGGIASDGTDLFVSTGNGTFAANNYGTSFVRLSATAAPLDYGTPADFATINATDKDINSGHVLFTSDGPGYIIGGGKDGRIFVLDKTNLGQLEGVGPGPHQLIALQNGAIFGCTVFANNSLILAALNTTMKRFPWTAGTGTFSGTPSAVGSVYSNPGPGCSYSSNGADTSTALLWGVTPAASAFSTAQAGTLRAWSGLTLAEIYNSGTVPGDALGTYAKFAMPTVANGRVFVPTFSNQISVYGIDQRNIVGGLGAIGGKGTIK